MENEIRNTRTNARQFIASEMQKMGEANFYKRYMKDDTFRGAVNAVLTEQEQNNLVDKMPATERGAEVIENQGSPETQNKFWSWLADAAGFVWSAITGQPQTQQPPQQQQQPIIINGGGMDTTTIIIIVVAAIALIMLMKK